MKSLVNKKRLPREPFQYFSENYFLTNRFVAMKSLEMILN